MNAICYFDNNATTDPLPRVVNAVVEGMSEGGGNASSAHAGGNAARDLLERSRNAVANLIGAPPATIYFTSGATESNNWVVQSWFDNGQGTLVTSNAEHSSVQALAEWAAAKGVDVRIVAVDNTGLVKVEDVAKALEDCYRPLVAVHWVNGETGVVQRIDSLGKLCRQRQGFLHVDGAQATGKMPVSVGEMEVDSCSLSAHKLHGPQGVGALYLKNRDTISPFLLGGGQESGCRAGTENLPGIVGFGEAARARQESLRPSIAYMQALRDKFEAQVFSKIEGVDVNGNLDRRVCNTSNLRFSGLDGQALVARLDQAGIRCSQGSACTNHRPEPSYVLRAMGLSEEEAYSSIRFAFSVLNSEAEIEQSVTILTELVSQLRRFQQLHQSA